LEDNAVEALVACDPDVLERRGTRRPGGACLREDGERRRRRLGRSAPAADAATIAPATRNVRRRSTCGILCREAISDVRVSCDTAQWTSAQMTQPTGVRATSKEARDRLALKRTRGRRTATNADRLQTVAPQKPASDVPVLAA